MGAMGEPSLPALLAATLLWLAIGVVPGLLLITWLLPHRSRLERVAVAPLLSIALAFAPAAWLSWAGVPQAWLASWAVPAVVTVVLVVVLAARGTLRALVRPSRTAAMVGVAVALATLVWLVAIALSEPGWSVVVPDTDGSSHGAFVARILLSGSLAPDQVAVLDLADPASQSVVYPLGLHSVAAPVAALTSVASALVVPLALLSSASLVAGSAAFARRVGGAALVAPAAVAAAVLVPWFPFVLSSWGPAPLLLAVSLVPAAALTLFDARGLRSGSAAALTLGGLLALHVTEALVVVLLALVALLVGGLSRSGVAHRARVQMLSLLAAALAVAPLLVGLVAAGRRPQEPVTARPLGEAALWVLLRPMSAIDTLDDPAPLVVAAVVLVALATAGVAAVGAVRAWRRPLGRSLVVVVATCLLLGLLAQAGTPTVFSYPWYGDPERIVAQAAALLPVLLAAGWRSLATGRGPSGTRVRAGACVVAVLLVAQALVGASDGFSRYSVVTTDDRAAFAWLASRVRPGDRVLNDSHDGSVWSYESTGGLVAPVFGPMPSGGYGADPLFLPRLHLRDHVAEIATDPVVRAEARSLSVRYVLVGSRTFSDSPRLLDVEGIEASPAMREVFRSGGARVFEIVGD